MKPERIQSKHSGDADQAVEDLLERFPEWVLDGDGRSVVRRWRSPTRRAATALVEWLCELADAVGSDPEISLRLNQVEARLSLATVERDASLALVAAVEGAV